MAQMAEQPRLRLVLQALTVWMVGALRLALKALLVGSLMGEMLPTELLALTPRSPQPLGSEQTQVLRHRCCLWRGLQGRHW
jgi:hypothetical protein